jgi:hypothetical protein
VNPTKMTEDEFLCAKNIVGERDPDAFATAAKEMGNALWTVADMQQDKQINWPSKSALARTQFRIRI